MKKILLGLALSALVAAPAMAEVRKGAYLYDANGRKVGQIDRVFESGALWVIQGGEIKTIPAGTVSDVNGKATTTLTLADVRKL